MRKQLTLLSLILFITSLSLVGCGGKYADAIAVNEEYIAMVEDYMTDIESADNAKDAAKAINTFADKYEKLHPKMKALSEKYPEFKDQENIPEEMKDVQKKAEEVAMKMGNSMMKLMPYMKDPDVQAAQKRLGQIMMQD